MSFMGYSIDIQSMSLKSQFFRSFQNPKKYFLSPQPKAMTFFYLSLSPKTTYNKISKIERYYNSFSP